MNNNRGYTILEALLGLIIISILSMPMYKLLTTERKLSASARDKATAYFICVGEMERLKSLKVLPNEITDSSANVDMNGKTYRLERKVKSRFEGERLFVDEKEMKEISVAVYSQEKILSRLVGLFGGLQDTVSEHGE